MPSRVDAQQAWMLRRQTDKFVIDLQAWRFLGIHNPEAVNSYRGLDILEGAAERMQTIMSKLDFPFVMRLTAGIEPVHLLPPEVVEHGSRQPHWGELLPAGETMHLDCLTRMFDIDDAGIDSRIGRVGLGYLTLPSLATVLLQERGRLEIINTQP